MKIIFRIPLSGHSPFCALLQLYELRYGHLLKHLMQMVETGIAHVKDCPLCKAKGFICELCNQDSDILFPFELHKVAEVRRRRGAIGVLLVSCGLRTSKGRFAVNWRFPLTPVLAVSR